MNVMLSHMAKPRSRGS